MALLPVEQVPVVQVPPPLLEEDVLPGQQGQC
jgi:hypothetical protein